MRRSLGIGQLGLLCGIIFSWKYFTEYRLVPWVIESLQVLPDVNTLEMCTAGRSNQEGIILQNKTAAIVVFATPTMWPKLRRHALFWGKVFAAYSSPREHENVV